MRRELRLVLFKDSPESPLLLLRAEPSTLLWQLPGGAFVDYLDEADVIQICRKALPETIVSRFTPLTSAFHKPSLPHEEEVLVIAFAGIVTGEVSRSPTIVEAKFVPIAMLSRYSFGEESAVVIQKLFL